MTAVILPLPDASPSKPPSTDKPGAKIRRLHPMALRAMHWVNAAAILVMIGSGITIYSDQPLFSGVSFPAFIAIGGDPETAYRLHGDGGFGGALLWHFAAMWVLVVNGLAYIAYGLVTGRFRRMLLPLRFGDIIDTVRDAARLKLGHADLTRYNAVQKLLYLSVIGLIVVQVSAGLALWKPVQFSSLAALFGGFDGARLIHFLGMIGIGAFLAIHVVLALLVPRTLVAMVTGGPRVAGRGGEAKR